MEHYSLSSVYCEKNAIVKVPVVNNDSINIREILNMTALLGHDVADSMEMAKFLRRFSGNIEKGIELLEGSCAIR
jgi:pyruvate/2-oxoglutarate dehydrogenase complex dihydrolipoamide acyltransferase (E2) component